MYKMILVDDESLIRTGLKNLIEWEVYGIEIVGEADEGTKAYHIIKNLKPDLALVDITMPNMNGLELIELCSHLTFCPKFIILSGYNNFEYVRTAMQYGAVNYLLKPVDQAELTNTIISTVRLLDDVAYQKLQFQESTAALRNDILIRLLTNRIDNKELREKCHFVNLSFHCNNMHIGILKPLFSSENNSSKQVTSSATDLCKKICERTCPAYTAIDTYNNIVLILKDYADALTDADYIQLLQACVVRLEQHLHVPVLTAVSQSASNVSELSAKYYQVLHAIEHQSILNRLFPNGVPATTEEQKLPDIAYSDFVQALNCQDVPTLKEMLHKYCEYILQKNASPYEVDFKYQLVEFIICTMQELESSLLSATDISLYKNEAFLIISDSSSLVQAEERLFHFFEHLIEQLKENTNPAYSLLVQNTLSYIKNHYSDSNLSLKSLARHMDVNTAYLGRQFALETNEYFSDYLNRVRISHAIHLLKTTDWKISGIAASVGFFNTNYFFTVFKKITGRKPGDYR